MVFAELLLNYFHTKAFKPAGLEFVWCLGITLEDSEGWRAVSMKPYGLLLLRKKEYLQGDQVMSKCVPLTG